MNRRTVTVSWGRVSYLEWVPEPGPTQQSTVVLLHGGGVDSALLSWGGIGADLARDGHRVLAPDHPGYGESPPAPWPATQQHLVDYTGEFVDALSLDRYAIGGLSLGGGMAIGHVLAEPEKVSGVMLLASYGLMPRLADGHFSGLRQAATWLLVRTGILAWTTRWLSANGTAVSASLASLIRGPDQRTPELQDEVRRAGKQGRGLTQFAQWQREQIGLGGLATDYTSRLGSVAPPVLLVHGSEDSAVPVARARAAAALIPDATLVEVPGAGHWVQRDAPARVLAAMTEFLSGLSRTGVDSNRPRGST
ncbi:alpha/beta hydrolase [Mycobacterium sp. ACS4331]|uniref:alpha/beta fold hydrolase n=1 Tax=Mycobacterium sp. ACS4331 TaxID=1834121 RepID=UPI000801C30D|nr:alpha/beta hydrolase [Mycobacterium sp. ACS4331]OBF22583.1 alpha/beta hydrolase [Mycobacterium sp. ACS4331]